jgi:hypothetical protein
MTMIQPGRARILIVDDEAGVLEGLERRLHALFDLTLVSDPKEAHDGQGLPSNGANGEAIPWGARALKAASDFDLLESQGYSAETAIETMRARTGWHDPAMLEAIWRLRNYLSCDARVLRLPLRAVQPGMVFTEDVMTRAGQVAFARGQEVTPSLVERVKNLALDSEVGDSVAVALP